MIKIIYILIFYLYTSSIYGLSVEETIKSTVENNPKIKLGLEKVSESKELIIKASGELLPDISSTITGTYTTSEKDTNSDITEDDTFADTYKIKITQNLYDAGYNQLEIERSKILFDNEILNFKIIVENLILDAINGYLTVMNYEKSLEATKKNYESVSKVLEETRTKYNLGSATLYELQTAESSFAISDSNLFSAKQNLLIGKKTFKRIVGLNPFNLEDYVDINANLDLNIIEKNAIEKNLSLKLLKNDIENKKILSLKEKKTKKPNLDLTGTAEYSDADRIDNGTETTKGTLSLTLTIPIFQKNIDDSNIRKFYSQILQAEITLQDTEEDLMIIISNTFKDFKVNESKMEAYKANIAASETSLLSLKQEYEIGTKTISDIVAEEEKLLNSKVNYFNSKKEYLNAYFKLQSLEGSLVENFKEYMPVLK